MDPIFAQWITWGIQLLVVLGLARVLQQQDKNTESLARLREELPKTYTPLPMFEIHRKENREDIHNLFGELRKHEVDCPARKAVQ